MAEHRADVDGPHAPGQLLKGWRERALLTQEQLAARAGLSVRSIRRFERGGTAQSASIRLVADALGLGPEERALLVTAPREPGAGRLRQLPGPSPLFTGRERELAELDRISDPAQLVVATISGMAGVGKTALAVQAAQRVAARYPDGQIYLDLHGYAQDERPLDPAEALDRVLRSLGVPDDRIPPDLDDRAALYRSRLAGRRTLIVLDNAATEAHVVPLLPGTPGNLVLVTSRRLLAGLDQSHSLTLDLLPLGDAVTLFTLAAGTAAGEPDAPLAELVELCGRLPLAVRVAAARLRSRPTWTVAHLVERLRVRRDLLAELEAGDRSVTAALDLSYQQLPSQAQRTYRLLGLHPGPDLAVHAAAALLGTAEPQAERRLDPLLDTHLLQEPAPGRFRFHDLVRAHSLAKADADEPEPDRRAARTRLLDHYRHGVAAATGVAYPHENDDHPHVPPSGADPAPAEPDAATAWLDAELPALLAVFRHAADHGWPEHAHDLAAALHVHLISRGRYATAEDVHGRALALARAAGDRRAELRALTNLGRTHLKQGRNERAAQRHEQALEIATAIGDRSAELNALVGLGHNHLLQGRYPEAAERLSRARELAHGTGHPTIELNALIGLGWLHRQLGEYERAFEAFTRAQELAHATGNRSSEVDALTGLGWQHRQQGNRSEALASFEEAHRIAHAIGSRHGELNAMIGLAAAQRVLGLHDQAERTYRSALALSREIGNRNLVYEALQGMGRLHFAAGRLDRALADHREALEVAAQLGQPADRANAHDGLAHAHHALGRHGEARDHWRQALDILTGLGTENTTDGEVSTAAIRARLSELPEEHTGGR